MLDKSAGLALYAAAVATLALGWQVLNAIVQNRFKNYETEFRSVETLINETASAAATYWSSYQRDSQLELNLQLSLDELDSKIESLIESKIIKAEYLTTLMIVYRQSITLSDTWGSQQNWQSDLARIAQIRRAANNLLHGFLKSR